MYMYLQREKGACRGFLPAPQVDLLLSNTCKVLNKYKYINFRAPYPKSSMALYNFENK